MKLLCVKPYLDYRRMQIYETEEMQKLLATGCFCEYGTFQDLAEIVKQKEAKENKNDTK